MTAGDRSATGRLNLSSPLPKVNALNSVLISQIWEPDSGDTDKHNDPVILFSHIPLARPKDSSCGSLRERGSINRGYGFGYQNTLGVETSQFLLETTRPSLIFRSALIPPDIVFMIANDFRVCTVATIMTTVNMYTRCPHAVKVPLPLPYKFVK